MLYLKDIMKNPAYFAYYSFSRFSPEGIYRLYHKKSKKMGLNRAYMVLSFDCDTIEDIKVVEKVYERVRDLGVAPVFAVPGELLKKGDKVYRKIAENGAEFINHGFAEHTVYDNKNKEYISTIFYDKLSYEEVEEDIIKGDETLKKVLGISPKGFRVPHFGSFQKPEQLKFLHSVLKRLGYEYSTSTLPYCAFKFGPVFDKYGLKEIPVSGMLTKPLSIMDSWGCYFAPDRTMNEDDYYREGKSIAEHYKGCGGVGILNYYVDPSHIHNSNSFYETIKEWTKVAKSVTYKELLEELNG